MQMPGRKYQQSGSTYRYSINGQEKESDINENLTTALYWEYDSRIGRRWNVDPVVKFWESPYACFNNNPINLIDVEGSDAGRRKHKEQSTIDKPKTLSEVVVVSKVKRLSKTPELDKDYSAPITDALKALKITPEQLKEKILQKVMEKILPPLPDKVEKAYKTAKEVVEAVKQIMKLKENRPGTRFPSAYLISTIISNLGGEGYWAGAAAQVILDEEDRYQQEREEDVMKHSQKDGYEKLNMVIDAYNNHYKDGFVRLWITKESLLKIISDKAVAVETLQVSTYNSMYNGTQNLLYSHMIYIKSSQFVNPVIAIENIGYIPTEAKASGSVIVK
jgi:hypothetical protein